MKSLVELSIWLLEKDVRAKNAISLLLALLVVVCFYFGARGADWMEEIDRRGTFAIPIALLVVFLISFLVVSLITSAIISHNDHRLEERRTVATAEQKQLHIRTTLESLTTWQRGFVLRYIAERTAQIPEFEVGPYRAAWDFEMEVLVQKGVVREHRRAGVYEINPEFRQYLIEHWDPKAGTLS